MLHTAFLRWFFDSLYFRNELYWEIMIFALLTSQFCDKICRISMLLHLLNRIFTECVVSEF